VKELKFNFGGLPEKFSLWKNAKFVVIPIPYDVTASYMTGARNGPMAILSASANLELFDDELKIETYKNGIFTAPFVEANLKTPLSSLREMEKAVERYIRRNRFPVIIGGEHTVTIGAMAPLKNKFGSFSVLQLDAHSDLRDSYQGTKWNHACVSRRILEKGFNIIQVGVRSLSEEEDRFIRKNHLKTYYSYELKENPEEVINAIIANLEDKVYITVDLDFFDPGAMPAVGTPEPGGIDWYGGLNILSEVFKRKKVIGFDVVELSPITGVVAPDFFAAKLVYRLMGYAVAYESVD
jgi:agmatinase